eukprot:1157397-Pelagomonas_calceolata.AAC.7
MAIGQWSDGHSQWWMCRSNVQARPQGLKSLCKGSPLEPEQSVHAQSTVRSKELHGRKGSQEAASYINAVSPTEQPSSSSFRNADILTPNRHLTSFAEAGHRMLPGSTPISRAIVSTAEYCALLALLLLPSTASSSLLLLLQLPVKKQRKSELIHSLVRMEGKDGELNSISGKGVE